MLLLLLDRTDRLLYPIFILSRLSEAANIKSSSGMLSLSTSHHSIEIVVAFQMMPQFFTYFFSPKTHHSRVLLQPFYSILERMLQRRCSSTSLFLDPFLDRLNFRFWSPRKEHRLVRKLALTCWIKEDVGQMDLSSTFFSIDSHEFRRIVRKFHGYLVSAVVTNSEVEFSIGIKEIVLTKKERQCIMGGVIPEEENEFLIPLVPQHIFYNITFLSERIWFFKTTDFSTMIIAPVGIFAQFRIYLPDS